MESGSNNTGPLAGLLALSQGLPVLSGLAAAPGRFVGQGLADASTGLQQYGPGDRTVFRDAYDQNNITNAFDRTGRRRYENVELQKGFPTEYVAGWNQSQDGEFYDPDLIAENRARSRQLVAVPNRYTVILPGLSSAAPWEISPSNPRTVFQSTLSDDLSWKNNEPLLVEKEGGAWKGYPAQEVNDAPWWSSGSPEIQSDQDRDSPPWWYSQIVDQSNSNNTNASWEYSKGGQVTLPKLESEDEKIMAGGYLALDPMAEITEEERSYLIDRFESRFGKGSIQALQENLSSRSDGTSDSVPAVINGVQPAAISEGEVIIPADAVAHLGNGSNEAGAKSLMDMVKEIRKAKTGRAEQPPDLQPSDVAPQGLAKAVGFLGRG